VERLTAPFDGMSRCGSRESNPTNRRTGSRDRLIFGNFVERHDALAPPGVAPTSNVPQVMPTFD